MLADILPAVLDYLRNDVDVTALVGTRVYGVEAPNEPPFDANGNLLRFVVVSPAGTGLGWYQRSDVPISSDRYEVRCYGPSHYEALRVYRAVHPALRQMSRHTRNGVQLFNAQQTGGPMSLRDPDAHWPFVLAYYTIVASEVAV